MTHSKLLGELFRAAVAAVDPRATVRAALQSRDNQPGAARGGTPVEVIALGKAAIGMSQGAVDALRGRIRRGLVVTTPESAHPRGLPSRFECRYGDHPIPGKNSLSAGEALLAFLDASAPDAHLLALISGGASSLLEVPAPGVTLDDIVALNDWLLGSGLDIRAMNTARKALSRIKGGGLRTLAGDRPTTALYISDVAGDRIADIGSAPFGPAASAPMPALPKPLSSLVERARQQTPAETSDRIQRRIIARLDDAIDGAARAARARGLDVFVHEQRLAGQAEDAGRRIVSDLLDARPGVYIRGGETVVDLPANPGRGGRNQTLALAAALQLADCCPPGEITLLAAGTDGIDGNSDAAGAIVDGDTIRRGREAGGEPEEALRRADSGAFLEGAGALLRTGSTGTNVTDIVLAIRGSAEQA